MSLRGSATRSTLGTVLLATLLTLSVGFVHKSTCFGADEKVAVRRYCYSDIVPLYRREGLSAGKFPYLEARNEYPVGTGLVMWAASLPGRGVAAFFLTNAILLAGLALLTAWLLERTVGLRALYFTAAPTLALYAFLNWDLLPVALATAGTVAFLQRRDLASGILLGLGAAAKVFPGFLLVPFALQRLHEEDRHSAYKLVASGAAAWLALNLPVAIARFGGWMYFFRFSSVRIHSPGTLWYLGCRALTGRTAGCHEAVLMNFASLVAFYALAAVIWRLKVARDPSFSRWTFGLPLLVAFLLTSKVYSPQYSLWLLPWFALVMPNFRLFALFEAADLMTFVAEFSYIATMPGRPGISIWLLAIPVLARAGVLVAMLVVFVRGAEPAVRAALQARSRAPASVSV